MMTNTHPPHRRTVRLPLGHRAAFSFTPETGLGCQWHPGVPQIESARAWRRFYAAYTAARDAFLSDVVTQIGGAVLVADEAGVTVIEPGVLQ